MDEPRLDDWGKKGLTAEDLPDIMRQLFDQCVADAQAVVDPGEDLDAFVDALWEQANAAFGLTRREWPADVRTPWPALVDGQAGVAEAVLDGRLGPGDLPA